MKNEKITADVESFKTTHGIEVHCISDRILLYLRWGAQKLQPLEWTVTKQQKDYTMDIYHKIRGDPKYTSKNPRAIAAAILYLGLVLRGIPILLFTITNLYDLSPNTIRKNCNEMIKDFGLKVPTKK